MEQNIPSAAQFKLPRLPKLGPLVPIILIVVFLAYNMCLVYVPANGFGIKKVNIGMNRGLQKKIYGTGLNFILPFGFQEMYVMPKDLQVLELTNRLTDVTKGKSYQKAVHIQTSDGFFVDVDVSILYHITDPYKVISTLGPGKLYITNGIIPRAEPVLKEALGTMATEDFYNTPIRVAAAKKAEQLFREELESKGLEVDHVLIRYFRYSPEIQRNIEEKKLKDQLVFKNIAEEKAAKELNTVKRIEQEGKASVQVRLEEGRAYVVKKSAEKELYVRKKTAEADKLLKLAEAKKVELKNEALSARGSDRRVGLAMAEVYKGIELIMLPSTGRDAVNPLDLDRTIELLGIEK